MNWRISVTFWRVSVYLITCPSICWLQNTVECPPCQSLGGDPYVYVLAGNDAASCTYITGAGGCVYRYEGTDELFCLSRSGYQTISSCTEPKEYFLLAAGDTDQNSPLSSALVYDSDWATTSLPDLPVGGGSYTGGVTGDRILLCTSSACNSWSGDSPSTWTVETNPPSYSLPTAITTYQGVWFSGGIPLPGRKKRSADRYEDFNQHLQEIFDDFTDYEHEDESIDRHRDLEENIDVNRHSAKESNRASQDPFVMTFLMTIDKSTGVSSLNRAVPDLTQPRFYHCGIENGDTPIVTGGISLASVYYSLVEQYNVVTGEVTQLPSLNVPRTNHGCTRFRQTSTQTSWSYIVAGGWNNGAYTTKVEVLHEGATSWVLVQDLPKFRLFTAMVTLEHQAYIVGGGEVDPASGLWVYQTSLMIYNETIGGMVDTSMQISPGRKSMVVFNIPRQVLP